MKKIAFSGTLDPITHGHMWVIGEARALADEVVVLISENPVKAPQFGAVLRKEIVEKSVAAQGWSNVSVKLIRGDYTARAAKRMGIDFLIRGIRNTSDFDYENLIQQANVDVLQGAKTLFVMPPRDLGSVSSSFVRGLQGPVGWHWTTASFMPAPAYQAWILEWLRQDWDSLFPDGVSSSAHWFEHLTGSGGYGAPQRHYHNLDHLVHGLTEIRVWAANTNAAQADVHELKKAFWFHDAVYGPKAGASNEELSALLWEDSQLDFEDEVAGPAELIRCTEHTMRAFATHRLSEVMLAVDLAILGQSPEVYDAYARAVRLEYSSVDDQTFVLGRLHVLSHFHSMAAADALYADRYFSSLYNEQARDNLAREIAALELRRK